MLKSFQQGMYETQINNVPQRILILPSKQANGNKGPRQRFYFDDKQDIQDMIAVLVALRDAF